MVSGVTFRIMIISIEMYGINHTKSLIISILLNNPSSWTSIANTLRHKVNSLDLIGVYNTVRMRRKTESFLKSRFSQRPIAYLISIVIALGALVDPVKIVSCLLKGNPSSLRATLLHSFSSCSTS